MKFSRLNPRSAALAIPLAALVIGGCGGGGGDTTEATQAKKQEAPAKLTKAEFIVRGDGICGEVNSAVGSIEASEVEVASSEQAAQVASLYTGMIERLTKLGTPSEMDGYAELSEAAEQLGKAESEVKAAAEKEDPAALEEASNSAVPALEGFQNAAAVYGFEECSEGPQAPSAATGPGPGAEEPGLEEEVAPELEEEFVPEAEEEVIPEEEFVPEEEAAPETGGAGGVGEGEGEVEGGGEEPSGGGIGPG
ncbi:MAG: hypothetical protein AB7V58_09065 [Solirubrobacterales bacterium]